MSTFTDFLTTQFSRIRIDPMHAIQPCGAIRQILAIKLRLAEDTRSPYSETLFWLELQDDRLVALSGANLPAPRTMKFPEMGNALLNIKEPGLTALPISLPGRSGTVLQPIKYAQVVPDMNTIEAAFLRLARLRWPSEFASKSGQDSSSWYPDEDPGAPTPPWVAARDAFLGRLDRTMAELDEHGHHYNIEFYNETMKWPTSTRRYRVQALYAYPWLWQDLGLSRSYVRRLKLWACTDAPMQTERHRPTQQAIDQGAPLAPVLCQRYGVSRGALRYLSYLESMDDPFLAEPVLLILDIMKPDYRISSFKSLRHIMRWAVEWGFSQDRHLMESLARELLQDGIDVALARIRKWAPSHSHISMIGCFNDLDDYLKHLVRAGHDVDASVTHMQQGKRVWTGGIKGLFEASDTWHRIAAAGMPEEPDVQWPARVSTPLRIGSHVLHELTSARHLGEEGRAMKHCVASYVKPCLRGQSIIFSVRSEQGQRLSTLQIDHDGRGCWQVVQHRGIANQSVPAELENLEKRIVKHLMQAGPRSSAEATCQPAAPVNPG